MTPAEKELLEAALELVRIDDGEAFKRMKAAAEAVEAERGQG